MRTATIKTALQEKLKELSKYLARFEKEQRAMRKEKHLAHATDMLEGLSHQIGYMNGAIEQTKQFLDMLEITDKTFNDRRRASEEYSANLKEQLRDMVEEFRSSTKEKK